MTMRVTLAAAAVMAALSAGSASAATYDIEKRSKHLFQWADPVFVRVVDGGKAVNTDVGGYVLSGTPDGASASTWDFVAWCIDLFVPVRNGGSSSSSREIMTADVSMTSPSALDPVRLGLVGDFFEAVFDPADIMSSRYKAGGFQLALWEILYEDTFRGDGFSLSTGDFQQVQHNYEYWHSGTHEDQQKARDWGNTFLAMWDDPARFSYDFTYLTDVADSDPSQSLITPNPSPIPLPAPALLLLGGIGALAAMKRRRA